MKIAVLSGKGGTGKTLVAVNLATVTAPSAYVDCDVEEPNGHLFFKPKIDKTNPVNTLLPRVDSKLCNGCRKCVDFCRFNALAYAQKKVLVFPDICHSCGGCMLICPQKAIEEYVKDIGHIEVGYSQQIYIQSGFLNPGETSGVPIIKELLESQMPDNIETIWIDCPPGSACIVMESIRDADYCVLVAEPTVFGAHNLKMVFDLVQLFGKPCGVVLNKCLVGDNPSEELCSVCGIPIIGRIPFDPELGEMNAAGRIVSNERREYQAIFKQIWNNIHEEEVCDETTSRA